jgi:hypothetical protein
MACLLLNGCGKSSNEYSRAIEALSKHPPDTDVTKSPNYFFSSFAGTVWRTKTKTAFADVTLTFFGSFTREFSANRFRSATVFGYVGFEHRRFGFVLSKMAGSGIFWTG